MKQIRVGVPLALTILIAGCGTQPSSYGALSKAPSQAAANTSVKQQPVGKKLFERALTDAEKAGGYVGMLQTLFGEGRAHKGGALVEVAVDALTTGLQLSAVTSFTEVFLPEKTVGSIVELVASQGKISGYDWGLARTFNYVQAKVAQGAPVEGISSLDEIKPLAKLLGDAKLLPFPPAIDSLNVYLNHLPRRLANGKTEWFFACLAVPYEGHYAAPKMVADARTGKIYSP
ncbi:MAG: hypothetical protein HY692_08665 [Cyanobacteria bacterium NC_groundwater_1444_Ag_S-0.65um_54_12]|nr:hypothetical protein [Cyanobacteria bacterium NC_groundwater_1444_Ag_S-0.65um_54_12]